MGIDFSKFDNMVDEKELQEQVANAKEQEFDDVLKGEYICSIEKMEVKLTKAGDKLMFSVQMKIKETIKNAKGKKEDGRWIFFNRIICGNKQKVKDGQVTWNDGIAIKGVMTWLKKLESGFEIEFKGYQDFADLVLDIYQDMAKTVEVEVKYDGDSFNSIQIKNVYDLD